jgi:hypothetical protein
MGLFIAFRAIATFTWMKLDGQAAFVNVMEIRGGNRYKIKD